MRWFALPTILAALSAGWWSQGAVSGHSRLLGVRNAHAMTYDPVGVRVVLFGGADAERVRGDTWMYRGAPAAWESVSDRGPAPRTFPAMTFDAASGAIVLFGGNRVLFGGYYRGASGTVRLGDTWEWDGRRWEQLATDGPAARNGGSLAYDESTERIVLVGGPPRAVSPEVWSWDGVAWTMQTGSPPPARFNAAMIYHSGLAALLRFGGWTGEQRAADTWARLSSGWRDLGLAGPSARNHTAMAHDAARGRTVLFGGHDGEVVFGDTWEFDRRAWTRVSDQPALRRVDNGH